MEHKKLYITLLTLLIIILGIGGTYALVSISMTATNITEIKSGNLTMTISGGGDQAVSFVPSKCTDENVIKRTITAKATNTSGGKISFSIGLNITELSDTYKRDTIRYVLTTNASSCNLNIIAGGNFKDKTVGEDVWLIKNDYDNITKSGDTYTKTYYLYIWLDESETEYFDGNISVKLKGTTSNDANLPVASDYNDGNGTNTLFYKIKNNADKITRIDFSQTSEATNTNGIYTTTNTDNGVPVYYYRGNIDNNHVIFANFCWKIIRTTETGGVKLIYDGVPSSGQCNNTEDATTIGNSAFNENYMSPAHAGYMYGITYTAANKDITTLTGQVVFGNDITYDASTNMYTLKNTYTLTDPSNWTTEYQTVASKYHYTCFSSSTSCQKVNYIHIIYSEDKKAYYFELSNGKNHLDILREMLDNSTNTTNSTVKTAIDTWYETNMTDYASQLEDTVFCNDRSHNETNIGWNKDSSNYNNWLYYSSRQRIENSIPSLICPSVNDKFTVSPSVGNGALTYPIGLITADEITYAGGKIWQENTSYYLHDGIDYWTMSPSDYFSWCADGLGLFSLGSFGNSGAYSSYGIRPTISLKAGNVLSSGNGTATDPYIVG